MPRRQNGRGAGRRPRARFVVATVCRYRPATALAAPATQPAAPPRRLFMLVKPRIIQQREVEQKPFPLLNTKPADPSP